MIGGLFITVISLRTGTTPDKDALSLLAGSVCAILLINGISLPLLYRFGAEKARMIYVLTFAGLGALLGGGGAVMDELQQNGPGKWAAACAPLAGRSASAGGTGPVCCVPAGCRWHGYGKV